MQPQGWQKSQWASGILHLLVKQKNIRGSRGDALYSYTITFLLFFKFVHLRFSVQELEFPALINLLCNLRWKGDPPDVTGICSHLIYWSGQKFIKEAKRRFIVQVHFRLN